MASASVLQKRCQEERYLSNLNDRFQDYVTRVRQFRENSSRIESNNLTTMTKALEDEIVQLKNLYEQELQHLRDQFDEVAREKNSQQLAASQNATKVSDLEEKLADELASRKKAENSYTDAQRTIVEKDGQLEDARIAITQEQNCHLDTQKAKDSLLNQLNQTTDLYSNEAASRGDFENLSGQLRDKLDFDRTRFEQEISDYHNRIADLETALRMAEERIHEHNIIDEDLAGQLAKVKIQSEVDFSRFKEESEINYQNSLAHVQSQLDNKCKELGDKSDENIKLKANIEELNARNTNAEAKATNTDNQNQNLINTLENERQKSTKTITDLEEKQRELQDNLNGKIRELNASYNASLPINVELEALGALLDAEDRRLKVSTSDQPQVITRAQYLRRPASPPQQRRASPPGSLSGGKPVRRPTSPKATVPSSRPSSVQPLPPVVDAPGKFQSQNAGVHSSLPEPPMNKTAPPVVGPRGWAYQQYPGTYPGTSYPGNYIYLDNPPTRKYSRYYAGANRHAGGYYTSYHRRFPTS